MSNTLREVILNELDWLAESYYPEHEYNDIHRDSNTKLKEEYADKLINAFIEALPEPTGQYVSSKRVYKMEIISLLISAKSQSQKESE